MTIDAHTHVFNVRYLPLRGIIDARAPWYANWAARALVKYLLWRSKDDPILDRRKSRSKAFGKSDTTESPVIRVLKARSDIAEVDEAKLVEFLIEEASSDKALLKDKDVYRGAVEAFKDEMHPDRYQKSRPAIEDEALLLELAGAKSFKSLLDESDEKGIEKRWKIKRLIRSLMRTFRKLGDFWHWLLLQTEPESVIMRTLINAYGSGIPGGSVTMFIDHMMDMELHYPGKRKPYYRDPKIRIDRMHRLYRHSQGAVFGFHAWCPMRDDGLDLAKQALEKKGFIGVKFYPPNGYRASGNVQFEAQDLRKRVVRNSVSAAVIDERNLALFKYCEDKHIPIFAHCQPGEMESVAGYTGKMSHPKYLVSILRQFRDLIVIFAHSGGSKSLMSPVKDNDPWAGTDESDECMKPDVDRNSFARAVYEACTDAYPHVYCGIGAHSEISEADAISSFRARLCLLFDESQTGRPNPFSERICYGSDWHMIYKDRGHALYLENYQKVFGTDSGLEAWRGHFFELNLLRFLHLPDYLKRARRALSPEQEIVIKRLISEHDLQ